MLYANNPQIDENCSNIYDGEVLCVAKEVLSPAAIPGRQYAASNYNNTAAIPSTTPENKQPDVSRNGGDDDDDLPECEDPNDDGY